ncbi:hypothetical protein ACFE04_009289 [Oxalis oulophora]
MASILLTIGEPILSDVISRLVDKATTSDFLHYVRKENLEALIPSCCSSFSLSNVKFGSKLKDITTRLEEIVKQKNNLGLTEKPYTKLEKRNATPSLNIALLQEKLKERLSLKKFLIVVDDVWNENVDDWETLCLPFITGVPGCKILVTTRNKFVMTTMNVTPHHLEQLSVEDCVLIMQDYALGALYRVIKEDFSGTRMLSYDVLHTILPEFKCLKVLSLHHYAISELPNNIDVLKLLRYLDLSWSHITRLPDSIAALYNLQTLILYQCSYLIELPQNIINLTELHKLDLADTKNLLEMPSGIRSLTKLQTLSKFIVSKGDKHQIQELQGLTRLRGKLSIYGLDNVQDIKDVRSANLKGKERLDDIALIWSNEFYDSRNTELEMQVLDLLEPNKNLKVLKIESYGGNEFSSWLGNPCFANLERFTLLRCKKCKLLPSLGRLPLLKYMCIEGNDGIERVGPEFFSGSKSFPMLDTLEFDNMVDFFATVLIK